MASNNDRRGAPSPEETEAADRLFEACVGADWERVPALCDEYSAAKKNSSASASESDTRGTWTDAELFSVIDSAGDENRRNPLLAAVLHVAVEVAAVQGSFSLFSDAAAQDLVDAEERKRLRDGGSAAFDDPLTAADFCPYVQMRELGDEDYPRIDDGHRRMRRTAIAKLCRANPIWILLPMVPKSRGKFEEDSNFDDELPRGTTALHVAVRSRNVSLTRLLVKYCPKACEIADVDGCIPLHYAVRPSDETAVLRRAVMTYQRSLNGGADNAPLEAGPNEVHSGVNLYYHGKVLFKATHESTDLARCRVRRLKRNHKLRMMSKNVKRASRSRRGGNKSNGNSGKPTPKKGGGEPSKCDNSKKLSHDKNGKVGPGKGANIYETPASLVRAMMDLGTVEEDSSDLVASEWNVVEDPSDDGLEARKETIASEYPIVVDPVRTVARGLGRAARPWRTEGHRIDTVKLLTRVHPQGVLYQCDDGGDTPLILACQTLKGDDGDDDDDEFGIDGAVDDDDPDERDDVDRPIPDAIGEDAADYEAGLPEVGNEDLPRPRISEGVGNPEVDGGARLRRVRRMEAEAGVHVIHLDEDDATVGEGDVGRDDGAGEDEHEDDDDDGEDDPLEDVDQGANDDEEDPLEAVMFMLAENGGNAMGIPDDDGDTALHAATRIGASPRLVTALLSAMPALSSTPAEDGSTPLHLACRRACDLAPGGNGGMGAYDERMIRALAEAAGAGALVAADDEGRTPFHVACRYRASPAVLAELADAEGGPASMLARDGDHHCPLGAYARHATDYHGLRVLVEKCPEAAAAMGDGRRLPLHRILACFNLAVNVDCLRLLGSAYPPALDLPDSRGMTPLALLCESYRSPLLSDLPKLENGSTTLERCLSNKIWLMARYLILAAGANAKWKAQVADKEDDSGKDLMLHAALREPSSSVEVIRLAAIIHPDEMERVDSDGDTPLHHCCRRRQVAAADGGAKEDGPPSDDAPGSDAVFRRVNDGVAVNEEPVGMENGQENSSRRRRGHGPGRDYLRILNHVLDRDVSAAGRSNADGKYALNVLVDGGSGWRSGGVDRVLRAFPRALFSYELSNGLFAMALARMAGCEVSDANNEERASSLGATFQLLRGKPTALECASRMVAQDQNKGGGGNVKRRRIE